MPISEVLAKVLLSRGSPLSVSVVLKNKEDTKYGSKVLSNKDNIKKSVKSDEKGWTILVNDNKFVTLSRELLNSVPGNTTKEKRLYISKQIANSIVSVPNITRFKTNTVLGSQILAQSYADRYNLGTIENKHMDRATSLIKSVFKDYDKELVKLTKDMDKRLDVAKTREEREKIQTNFLSKKGLINAKIKELKSLDNRFGKKFSDQLKGDFQSSSRSGINSAINKVVNVDYEENPVRDLTDNEKAELGIHFFYVNEETLRRSVGNTVILAGRVQKQIRDGIGDIITKTSILRGKNSRYAAKEILKEYRDKLGKLRVSVEARVKMIARTETRKIQEDANLASFAGFGVKKVEVIYLQGAYPCKICPPIASGGPYFLDKVPEGGIPFHPNCACSYAPFIDKDTKIKTPGFIEDIRKADEKPKIIKPEIKRTKFSNMMLKVSDFDEKMEILDKKIDNFTVSMKKIKKSDPNKYDEEKKERDNLKEKLKSIDKSRKKAINSAKKDFKGFKKFKQEYTGKDDKYYLYKYENNHFVIEKGVRNVVVKYYGDDGTFYKKDFKIKSKLGSKAYWKEESSKDFNARKYIEYLIGKTEKSEKLKQIEKQERKLEKPGIEMEKINNIIKTAKKDKEVLKDAKIRAKNMVEEINKDRKKIGTKFKDKDGKEYIKLTELEGNIRIIKKKTDVFIYSEAINKMKNSDSFIIDKKLLKEFVEKSLSSSTGIAGEKNKDTGGKEQGLVLEKAIKIYGKNRVTGKIGIGESTSIQLHLIGGVEYGAFHSHPNNFSFSSADLNCFDLGTPTLSAYCPDIKRIHFLVPEKGKKVYEFFGDNRAGSRLGYKPCSASFGLASRKASVIKKFISKEKDKKFIDSLEKLEYENVVRNMCKSMNIRTISADVESEDEIEKVYNDSLRVGGYLENSGNPDEIEKRYRKSLDNKMRELDEKYIKMFDEVESDFNKIIKDSNKKLDSLHSEFKKIKNVVTKILEDREKESKDLIRSLENENRE